MSGKVGLWLIGARGGVATTCLLGLELLKQERVASQGLVSAGPAFAHLPFLKWNDLVVGGHEIRSGSLAEAARQFAVTNRTFALELVEDCRQGLTAIDEAIRPGVVRGAGATIAALAESHHVRETRTPADAVAAIQTDLSEFADRHALARVLVVNVASTEPKLGANEVPRSAGEFRASLTDPQAAVPASALYAWAALDLGYPYINFTPSLGSDASALRELALERGVCHAGRDGKTGETWLKSVLAPAFLARNLPIMSWVGHNIFGNLDGRVLDDPRNKATKITSKDELLGRILGYHPQTHISIEYIESLGDWKTAWDHIHFQGFLGTPMMMQFTWQGCDSILAAPLVLDLVRFTELAQRRGESGELGFLGAFFKSPQGAYSATFFEQYQELIAWAAATTASIGRA